MISAPEVASLIVAGIKLRVGLDHVTEAACLVEIAKGIEADRYATGCEIASRATSLLPSHHAISSHTHTAGVAGAFFQENKHE